MHDPRNALAGRQVVPPPAGGNRSNSRQNFYLLPAVFDPAAERGDSKEKLFLLWASESGRTNCAAKEKKGRGPKVGFGLGLGLGRPRESCAALADASRSFSPQSIFNSFFATHIVGRKSAMAFAAL